MQTIKDMQVSERPREKLYQNGPEYLSDHELIAVILGSGNSKANVFELSKKALSVIDECNDLLTVRDLSRIDGIGMAKASLLCAALEFARRRIRPEGVKVKSAADVFPLIRHYAERKQEHFICVSLNGAHEVMTTRVVTIGLLNSTQIHPREVFADPIAERAASVIIAHNHPSGNLTPSEPDLKATRELVNAGKLLGIKVLDHVIFSRNSFLSFQEEGLIN